MQSNINCFFSAKSVAVVGATTNPDKLGFLVLKNIIAGGFKGRIYAVNQKGGSVMNLQCYKSLSEINEVPDIIVVIVPSSSVLNVIEEAGKLGVKGAIIISGGFGESGNNELERELVELSRKYSIRIQGPNCQGLIYNPNKFCASWPLVSSTGHIAIIAQSGTVGAEIGIRAQEEDLGVSAIVSLGNKSETNELDFIKYFSEDDNTNAIGLYLEGVTDGRRFIELAREVTSKKPFVVLKSGRTPQGKQAVQSHTKSLAGMSQVFNGMCRQYGIVNAKNITEFYDLLKGFAYLKPPKGKNVMVVTSSGGSGALAADELSESGLNLIRLSPEIEKDIKAALPKHCIVKNPIDLTGDATPLRYKEIVSKVSEDKNVDIIFVVFGDPFPGVGEAISSIRDSIEQTLVVCYLGGGEVQKQERSIMHRNNIPVFSSPEGAVHTINKLVEYSDYLGITRKEE